MTTAERSETPGLDALIERHIAEAAAQRSEIGSRVLASNLPLQQVRELIAFTRAIERELTALRLRYTWKPMKDAPRDRKVLIKNKYGVSDDFARYAYAADGWMEIP